MINLLYNSLTMKKIVFIAVCIVGLISFSSCRSTSKSCAYTKNTKKAQKPQQTEYIVTTTVAE